LLGEHNEAVLGEILGVDRAEYEALRREGAV
jgi:crotonobetainyl-CoA:carnitine CoA-transferase CaiB-like acyl-CoA transferase